MNGAAIPDGQAAADMRAGSPATMGRDVALDALRGVAIFLVIIHHVGLRFPESVRDPVGQFLVSIGWGGVDIFFAISGFLITRILLQVSNPAALAGFFLKRFFRIVPLYLVALALFLAMSLIFGGDREVIGRLWMNLLFLTAWVIPFVGENGVPYTITWSVSVEEFAYLLFGCLALLGPRPLRLSLLWVALAALIVRFLMVYAWTYPPETAYYFAPGRIDAIAIGGIAAAFASLKRGLSLTHPAIPLLLTLSLLGVLAAFGRGNPNVAIYGYSLVAVGAAWLVGSVAHRRVGRSPLPIRGAASLGLVSYFVYLFHGFVIAALSLAIPSQVGSHLNVWLLALLATLLTYIPALLSWKYFELPLIRFGRRLADKKSAVATCG